MSINPLPHLIHAPAEVIFRIFQYLDKKDIDACACTSRKLRDLAKDFWRASFLLRQEFGFRMKLPNVASQEMYHSLRAAHVSSSTYYSPEKMYEQSQQERDPLVVFYWLWEAAHLHHRGATFQLALMFDEGPMCIKNEAQAVKWYQRAAALGDPNGMKCVGDRLLSGRGIPKNEQKAKELYEKASDLGNTDAMVALGTMFMQGVGGSKDETRAVDLYTKAAEQGNSHAMTQLGVFFEGQRDIKRAQEQYERAITLKNAEAMSLLGRLFEKENRREEAIELHRSAAELDNAYSLNWLGLFCERAGEVRKAVVFYESAAALNYVPSMENLAYIFMQGRQGIDANKQEALKLLEKAAGLGSTKAMRRLGHVYLDEVPKNHMQAAIWFQKAAVAGANDGGFTAILAIELYEKMAASGDMSAMHCLGHLYETGGKDLSQDLPRAAEWYQKAAEAGHALSMVALGNMLQLGSGIPQDLSRAVEWYRKASALDNIDAMAALGEMLIGKEDTAVALLEKAAERGHLKAMRALGEALTSGQQDIPINEERAVALCKKGAKSGDVVSMLHFAVALEEGRGIFKDQKRAFKWYKRAAKAGNRDAIYGMALMLKSRIGSKNKRRAFKWCQRAAEAGSPRAMVQLGCFYEKGTGIPKDLAKAKEWYQQAAIKGDLMGMYSLGLVYYHKNNYQEAFRCFSKAIECDASHAPSLQLLGSMYELGQHVAQDKAKAARLYEKAAGLNHAKATYHLASIRDTGQNLAGVLALYAKAAGLGCAEAALKLGEKYLHGIDDVPSDDLEAAEWYQKAAALHSRSGGRLAAELYAARSANPVAMRNLGIMYENGQGIDKDLNKAMKYYRKAARLGDPIALDLLGDREIKQDLQKAKELYQRAATLGNIASMAKLAALLEKEEGRDEKRIAELYERAADDGNVFAMKKLAVLCQQGRGCDKDPRKAALLYHSAASRGDLEAIFKLATLFERGRDLVQDLKKAGELYERAAIAGNAIAMARLAALYKEGRGVPKDAFRAASWYQRAAKTGLCSAMVKFGFMCETGDGIAKDDRKAFRWYQRAIDGNNNEEASVRFAIMVAEGRGGLDKNVARAKGLLEKVVEKGNAQAMSYLAILLAEGKGIGKDEKRALELYQKATSLGDKSATERLGPLIAKREIIPVDPKNIRAINSLWDRAYSLEREGTPEALRKAAELFHDAAVMGYVPALNKLALLFEEGTVITKNIPKANICWRRAANGGDPEAMIKLGEIYMEGRGVTQDPQEAARLYQMAFTKAEVLESSENSNSHKAAACLYLRMAQVGVREAMLKYAQMAEDGRGMDKDEQLAKSWRERAESTAETEHYASTALESSPKRVKLS